MTAIIIGTSLHAMRKLTLHLLLLLLLEMILLLLQLLPLPLLPLSLLLPLLLLPPAAAVASRDDQLFATVAAAAATVPATAAASAPRFLLNDVVLYIIFIRRPSNCFLIYRWIDYYIKWVKILLSDLSFLSTILLLSESLITLRMPIIRIIEAQNPRFLFVWL